MCTCGAFPISITFCGQNMCRILIKIWPEYCSIFHGEYSRLARNFAHTSSLGIGLSVHLNRVEALHQHTASSYWANLALEASLPQRHQ